MTPSSSTPSTPPDVHALTGPYVLDALPADERVSFERHLADCAPCAAEVRELQETAARVGNAVHREAPLHLKRSVLAAIGHVRQLPPVPSDDDGPPRISSISGAARHARRRPSIRTFLAVAAAIVMIAGVGGVALDRDRDAGRLQQANGELAAVLRSPDTQIRRAVVTGGGDATVVTSASRDVAVILLAGLPAAPEGKAYQMWFIEADRARSLGLTTDAQAEVVRGGINRASAFGMTVEPIEGSEHPTSPTIALVGLT